MEEKIPTDIDKLKAVHNKRQKNKIAMRIALICGLVLIVFGGWFLGSVYKDMTKLQLSESIYITLSGKESLTDISKLLKENGVIKHRLAFEAVAKIKNLDDGFGVGRYKIEPNSKYTYVLRVLREKLSEMSITIIEGKAAEEIFDAISESGFVSKDELKSVPKEKLDYWFLKDIKRENYLEGYLYPDTYIFSEKQTSEEMLEKLLSQFDKVFLEEYKKRAKELEMSVDEVVILASVIQAEASNIDDMQKVSSVFHKRLKANDRLQSCASVLYVLGEKKSVLSEEDVLIDSPYNTYMYKGLTPGPICSPGRDAIYAALYPADCTYYYFQSDEEGNMYFSDTFEEHEKIRKKIQKEQN